MDSYFNETPKNCVYCNSIKIRFVQIRNNLSLKKSIYQCENCNRKFTPDDNFKKFRHSPTIIKTALELLKKGLSLSQIVSYLNQNFRIKVTRKTILDWKNKFIKKK